MTTTIRGTDNSAAAPALTGNDSDTGIYFPAADTLGLVVGGSEAARVTSTKQLLVTNNGASNQGSIRINNQAFTGSTSTGPHIFGYEGANSLWWLGSFDSAVYGDDFVVEARQGAVRFYTNNALAATINTSGNLVFPNGQGIDFSASAGGGATSSLLDDYEEGTWTPTLPQGGTIGLAPSTSAVYTKIGRQVTVSAFVQFSSIPNNGNNFQIGGLPYALSFLSTYPYGSGSLSYTNLAVTDDLGGPLGGPSSSVLYFHFLSGSNAILTNANAVSKGWTDAIFTYTYFVA